MGEALNDIGVNRISSVVQKLGLQLVLPSQTLIDWDIAALVAMDVAGVDHEVSDATQDALRRYYSDTLDQVEPLIEQYVGVPWPRTPSPVLIFDRSEWILATCDRLKNLVEPLADAYFELIEVEIPFSVLGKATRKVGQVGLTAELGIILGQLATKVMAQYDLELPGATAPTDSPNVFYFIEPNVKKVEQGVPVDPGALRRWIVLHEATHGFEFQAFPWVKTYIDMLLWEYLYAVNRVFEEVLVQTRPQVFPTSAMILDKLRSRDMLSLVSRIQSVMSVVEGYSEHVMRQVGMRLPAGEAILSLFQYRREHKGWAERLLERLLGLEIKMKQYVLGERFFSRVVETGGLPLANAVWAGPDFLPTWAEVVHPETWVSRVKNSL